MDTSSGIVKRPLIKNGFVIIFFEIDEKKIRIHMDRLMEKLK